MIKAKIRDNYYKMIDNYSLQNSAHEVKFSEIKIDFTDANIDDLPLQYEEIQIIECTENETEVIFFGYAESYKFSEMKNNDEDKELTISILSPMELATLRTVTLQGYYNLQTLLNLVLAPLFDEGFTLAYCNVTNNNVTVSFLMQTVEYCMNYLSNSNNLFWFINAKKEIYIYDISYLFEQEPILEISDSQATEGLIGISPELEAVNYANVLNIKNARVFFSSHMYYETGLFKNSDYLLATFKTKLNNGDTLTLNYPFSISSDTLQQIIDEGFVEESTEFETTEVYAIYIKYDEYIKRLWYALK